MCIIAKIFDLMLNSYKEYSNVGISKYIYEEVLGSCSYKISFTMGLSMGKYLFFAKTLLVPY